MSEPTPREIWDSLNRKSQTRLAAIYERMADNRRSTRYDMAADWELVELDLIREMALGFVATSRRGDMVYQAGRQDLPGGLSELDILRAQLAALTAERDTALREVEVRDKRLAAIAARARDEINDLGADGVDDLNALLDIESLADGQPRRDE